MTEPRNDMLPDQSQTDPDGSEPVPTPEPVAPKVQEPPPVIPAHEPVKTPPEELLGALREEREMRKEETRKRIEAERKLADLASAPPQTDPDGFSVDPTETDLVGRVQSLERAREEDAVYSAFPLLKEHQDAFTAFTEDYKGVPLVKVAKVFMAEKGLNEAPKPRRGLEKPTGGSRAPVQQGFTAADIDRLMKNEPRKFEKLVRDGVIDPDNIL